MLNVEREEKANFNAKEALPCVEGVVDTTGKVCGAGSSQLARLRAKISRLEEDLTTMCLQLL